MKVLSLYVLASAFMLMTGCQASVGPDSPSSGELHIFTEQESYRALDGEERGKEMPTALDPAAVVVHVVNRGAEPVHYLWPGGYVGLDRETSDGWEDLGPWYMWIMVAPRPEEIAPGDTLTRSIKRSHEYVREPGTYRFRFKIYDEPGRSLLPTQQRVSNAFEIVGAAQ